MLVVTFCTSHMIVGGRGVWSTVHIVKLSKHFTLLVKNQLMANKIDYLIIIRAFLVCKIVLECNVLLYCIVLN